MARAGLKPSAQIIGRLDLSFGATGTVPRSGSALTDGSNRGIRKARDAGLILTDPTVWTREAWGTLAAVPVIPVNTGSTVVTARRKEKERPQFLSQDTPRLTG